MPSTIQSIGGNTTGSLSSSHTVLWLPPHIIRAQPCLAGLPPFLWSFPILPCRMVFARVYFALTTCPNHLCFLFLTISSLLCSVYLSANTRMCFSRTLLTVHDSQAYKHIKMAIYSSTCHERTPSGPGKSVRTLQVAAHQRDGWAR